LDSHSTGAFGEPDRIALERIVCEHLAGCDIPENPGA
jgi:hypothetical protein